MIIIISMINPANQRRDEMKDLQILFQSLVSSWYIIIITEYIKFTSISSLQFNILPTQLLMIQLLIISY